MQKNFAQIRVYKRRPILLFPRYDYLDFLLERFFPLRNFARVATCQLQAKFQKVTGFLWLSISVFDSVVDKTK